VGLLAVVLGAWAAARGTTSLTQMAAAVAVKALFTQ
jgi:hypothetical protein